jgi:DNA-binding MarR family transcriptional regulator
MQMSSQAIARLVEPVLFVAARPTEERVKAALDEAQSLWRDLQDQMQRERVAVHEHSYELGASAAFLEILSTLYQRSSFTEAVRAAQEAPQGVETLHVIGMLGRSAKEWAQGDLADALGTDRGNFNRHVKRLLDANLVAATRAGKRVVYSLTLLGMDVLTSVRPGWEALHPSVGTLFETEEQAANAARGIAEDLQRDAIGGEAQSDSKSASLRDIDAVAESAARLGRTDLPYGRPPLASFHHAPRSLWQSSRERAKSPTTSYETRVADRAE